MINANNGGLALDAVAETGKQQFPDLPSETPTAAEVTKWYEACYRSMSEDQRSVMTGRTPASLLGRAPVDVDTVYPDSGSKDERVIAAREDKRAGLRLENLHNRAV